MAGIDITKLSAVKTGTEEKTDEGSSIFAFLNKDIRIFAPKLSDKKKERFYFELNILLTAGVDIESALELIVEQQRNKKDKTIYENLKREVLSHGNLAKAMESTGLFSPYETVSIEMGQETGMMSEVLEELAKYYGRTIKQKRQLVNALSYPVIVLVASFGTVFFMMKFIVPLFADFFKRLGGELPYITSVVISFSDQLSNYSVILFFGLITAVFSCISQRKKTWYKRITAIIILKMPIIGPVIKKTYIARFCSSMAMLLSAKIHTSQALELVSRMITFYPLKRSIEQAKEEYIKGVPLYTCLSKHDLYPAQMLSLIKVSEEVNKVDVIFSKLSKQYSEEVEQQTEMLGSLIQPILLLFIGGFVAIILIAMYLPMFQVGTTMHQ
jgi:type IV pilus assembly protein PilC